MENIVYCPKCQKEVLINVKNAIDELGEIYVCPECKWKFMV